MRLRVLAFAAALAALPTVASAATKVGGWDLDHDKDGDCFISQGYDFEDGGEGVMAVGFLDHGESTMILFQNTGWNMPAGQKYPTKVSIDNLWTGKATALISEPTAFLVQLPTEPELFESLVKGAKINIGTAKGDLWFTLNGTMKSVPALLSCQDKVVNGGASKGNPFRR